MMELMVDIEKKLPGFNLEIKFEAGLDTMGLLGASGSGKSMTLRCIAGLETPDRGRIVLNGRVLFDSEKRINLPSRKRNIGFLFQNYALFPHMTVEQNIGFGLAAFRKKEKAQKIEKMIEMMHLYGLEKRYPQQLSGGQQQRAALARALVVEPEALLLDEPFSALDDHLRNLMVEQLMESLSGYRGTTLFVSHNMEEAYRVCKTMVILSGGRKAAQGSREVLFKAPPTLAAARITGCKNLSGATKVSWDIVDATEWNCSLHVYKSIKNVSHIGIRAHNISLADERDKSNVLRCWPAFISETPFKTIVYLSVEKPPSGRDYHLQWEISSEKWLDLKDAPLPWNICLKPDRIILISENED